METRMHTKFHATGILANIEGQRISLCLPKPTAAHRFGASITFIKQHAVRRAARTHASTDPVRAPEIKLEPLPEASTSGRQETQREPQSGGPEVPYKFIAALAAAGAAITGYLALEKITGGEVACPASGSCETILSSGYATVLGIPLSLLGFLAYSAVGGLAGLQAVKARQDRQDWERLGVLGGATVLASTSASLLYLLFTQFPGQSCTWCFSSAFLSFSVFMAAASGFRLSRELASLGAPGGLTAGGTILFLFLAWNGVEAPQAMADIDIPYQETVVRGQSTPQAVELARRLREAGAKMYGAFWCSHCQEQKVDFGAQAQKDLPYVECFPEGFRQGVEMAEECKAAKLDGFPMWVINGNRYSGEQKFSQLEAALQKQKS